MEKKELSLQLNNINIGDFKMKKTNFAVAGLSLCLLFSSCGTNQKTGTAVGAGSGAAHPAGDVDRVLDRHPAQGDGRDGCQAPSRAGGGLLVFV